MGDFETRLAEGYAAKTQGGAMTPEARLAAALHEVKAVGGPWRPCQSGDGCDCIPMARHLIAADPTLAADLALAAAVREPMKAWHDAYRDRWDAMTSDKPEPDPRIEADATLALYRAIEEATR